MPRERIAGPDEAQEPCGAQGGDHPHGVRYSGGCAENWPIATSPTRAKRGVSQGVYARCSPSTLCGTPTTLCSTPSTLCSTPPCVVPLVPCVVPPLPCVGPLVPSAAPLVPHVPRGVRKVSPYFEVDGSIFGLGFAQPHGHGFVTVLSSPPNPALCRSWCPAAVARWELPPGYSVQYP